METINDRISKVVAASGKNKTEFAKSVNISQPFLSQICAGTKTPSDRTIADICRVCQINEVWLRTGKGEKERPISRNAEIEAFMNSVMQGEDADFRRRLVAVLAKLDTSEWELLERMAQKLAAEASPAPRLHVIKKAGRDGSFTETVMTDEEEAQQEAEYNKLPDASDDL